MHAQSVALSRTVNHLYNIGVSISVGLSVVGFAFVIQTKVKRLTSLMFLNILTTKRLIAGMEL